MSGVVALMSMDSKPVDRELAVAMLARASHRGDQPPIFWIEPNAILGHTHRATTPEALHEQLPASDPSGRFWLTWDGRLDNREALAKDLELSAADARDLTDAAYVLQTFARWEDAAVRHLVGDWALVVYDRLRHRLIAARDPVGHRPLFAAQHKGVIAICSEPQQFVARDFIAPTVNLDYLHRVIANAMTVPGSNYLENITEIEGGTMLVADGVRVQHRRFWSQPRTRALEARSPDECVDAFVEVFEQAVAARTRSIKPIGVYLSGGIDSSYVTAVASKHQELTSFTSYATGKRTDERRYARIVVEHTGVKQREFDVNDCWSLSSKHVPDTAFDQPSHPGQSANHLLLGRAAQEEGIGVVLDGVGGDEWLTGAPYFLPEAIVQGHPLQAWNAAVSSPRNVSAATLLLRESYRGLVPLALRDRARQLAGRGDRNAYEFSPYVDIDPTWCSVSTLMSDFTAYSSEPYRKATWEVYRSVMIHETLWRDRQAEQPFGIERRSPFDDLRVIELLASMPEWVKRFRGRRKDLLRAAVDRHMPVIGDRLDHGLYDELFLRGVRENERPRVDAAIEAVATLPGVHGSVLRNDVGRFLSAQHDWWQPAWRVISTGMWLNNLDTLRGAQCATAMSSLANQERHAPLEISH